MCSAIELTKDVTIVVLGASGDLAKKKTVNYPITLPQQIFFVDLSAELCVE